MPIRSRIRTVEHWPKPGVMFRDITTLLKDPIGLKLCLDDFVERYQGIDFDKVIGIDSRGFILGGALAYLLEKGFIPIRKENKLPFHTVREEYELEYGYDAVEIHRDAVSDGEKVIIIDDLIATGGTALAAANLVGKLGGNVIELGFIVELPDLGGVNKLTESGYKYYAQTSFAGD